MANNHIQLVEYWVKRMMILFMIIVFNVEFPDKLTEEQIVNLKGIL